MFKNNLCILKWYTNDIVIYKQKLTILITVAKYLCEMVQNKEL